MCRRVRLGMVEAGQPPGNIGWKYWVDIFGVNVGENIGWK